MQITDSTICSLLEQHNEKGMEYLFTRYYKPLVIWAATFLNDLSRSEDLVQDFFIKLWEKEAGRQLKAATLKSFLYTSVRNLALDRLEKKDPLRHASDIQLFEKSWEEYDTFEEELLNEIRKQINELPNRSREIIRCVYLEGLPYKETAAKLGISVSTVNSSLVNSLKKIRRQCAHATDAPILLFFFLRKKYSRNIFF